MHFSKTILLLLFCLSSFFVANAQKSKEGLAVYKIYEDLPLDEAGKKSVINPNENTVKKISENIFIKTSFSKTNCYVGEPIILTYQLYSSLLNESTVSRNPSFQGFNVRKIPFTDKESNYKTIKNRQFRVFMVEKYLLTPYETGALSLGPIGIHNVVSYEDNNGKRKSYSGEVNSQSAVILVKALPKQSKQTKFSGAVGKFSISLKPDKTEFKVNSSNHIQVEIVGVGNLSDFSFPDIKWPSEFEVFEPTEKLSTESSSVDDLYARKTFDATIIAKKEGKYIIGPLCIWVFNPATNKYEEITSQSPELIVNKNVKTGQGVVGNIKSLNIVKNINWIYFALALLIVCLVPVSIVIRKIRKPKNAGEKSIVISAVAESKRSQADYEALVKETAANADDFTFPAAFKNVIRQYLIDKTKARKSDSDELLIEELALSEPSNADAITTLIELCNKWLYSPGSIDKDIRVDMTERFLTILNTV